MSAMTTRQRACFLVTGGAGFIGRHLIRRLTSDGHRVRVLDDLTSGTIGKSSDIDFEFIRGSVLDKEAVERSCDKIDGIFHLAGIVGMRLASELPALAHRVADVGTENILAASDVPVVLFSSSAVYGNIVDGPAKETDTLSRAALREYDGTVYGYASGKLCLEERGRRAMARGRPVIIVRPFNVVGPGQTGTYGMVLPNFLRLARCGRPLEIFDDGSQTRCFSAVETFVDSLLRLVAVDEAWSSSSPAVNIGASVQTTIHSLASTVLEQTDSRSELHFRPYEDVFPGRHDVRSRVPNTSVVDRLIGPTSWPSITAIVRNLLQERIND